MTTEQFLHITKSENGVPEVPWAGTVSDIAIDGWVPLPVFTDGKVARAKYNALVRLPDIDGVPAVTLSTWRDLPLSEPSEDYLRVMADGVRETRLVPSGREVGAVDTLLREARMSRHQPTSVVALTGAGELKVRLDVSTGKSSGFPCVKVPACYAEVTGSLIAPILGRVVLDTGQRFPAWVVASADADESPTISPDLADKVAAGGGDPDRIQLAFHVPCRVKRLQGRLGSLAQSDVVQVNPADAGALGEWALVVSPRLSAPMKVVGKEHVPRNRVRIAYASRRMLALEKGEAVVCQPIDRRRERLRTSLFLAVVSIFEWLLGAPPVALRVTEGLVGDDGRMIVRVDQTALDFLGVASGDEVVVTWAYRRARARVLLHTDITRDVMREQLNESTGLQARAPSGDVESRLKSPEHLRVWVSASVRTALSIPADTILRVRRSLPHLMAKNLAVLAIPVTGAVLAGFAVPDLSWWVVALVLIIAVAVAFAPLRLK